MSRPVDRRLRREFYNRCKPSEPLEPGDERYVDLDAPTATGVRVRGVNWVEKLAAQIELSDEPVCELFTGLPGSGKSTELKRLAQRLGDPDGANLLPILISAEDVFDLGNPIDIPDIIFAILHVTEETLLRAEGKDPETAMQEGYFRRLWSWLSQTDIELGKGEFAVPEVGKLLLELKTRPSLRERVRKTISTSLSRFLKEARDELGVMQGRATHLGHEGLIVIIDSLEKLRGTTSNWDEVLSSAERIFAGGAPYLRLPVHVLYTIPPALAYRQRFDRVLFIPMIKLRDREGNRFEPGFQAAKSILTQRVPSETLTGVMGPSVDKRLERLIEWSGGYPRELVRLLQAALAMEEWPLSDSDFQRILNEVGDQYRKLVPANAFAWLARIAVDRYLTVQSSEHHPEAEQMLTINAVLRYLNDQDWFDLHPAVREIPGVAEEVQRLKQQEELRVEPRPAPTPEKP
ncbi:MAG TPA: hypothetical protein VLQ93_02060 [Myxococcaceae bacterium]|nr:hypothetical protein [Myxococcaceae bacterium]